MEVAYFIKSRDRTGAFLAPEVALLRASLPSSRSVLCVGDCEGRTGGLRVREESQGDAAGARNSFGHHKQIAVAKAN